MTPEMFWPQPRVFAFPYAVLKHLTKRQRFNFLKICFSEELWALWFPLGLLRLNSISKYLAVSGNTLWCRQICLKLRKSPPQSTLGYLRGNTSSYLRVLAKKWQTMESGERCKMQKMKEANVITKFDFYPCFPQCLSVLSVAFSIASILIQLSILEPMYAVHFSFLKVFDRHSWVLLARTFALEIRSKFR